VPIAALFVFGVVWAARRQALDLDGRVHDHRLPDGAEDVPNRFGHRGHVLAGQRYRPTAAWCWPPPPPAYFLLLRFYRHGRGRRLVVPTMYKEFWADGEHGLCSVIKTLITNPLF